MKTKMIPTLFVVITFLAICVSGGSNNMEFNREGKTLFKREGNVFNVIRIYEHNEYQNRILKYVLDANVPESLSQKFINEEIINKKQNENIVKEFNWKQFKGNNVVFVQIQPIGFKTEMELLNVRQEIEDRIGKRLTKSKLGEWLAGDLGPGGGNMLFEVNDMEKAIENVLETLHQNKLENKAIIGRRIYREKDDWFYEVIYPEKYSGKFDTR